MVVQQAQKTTVQIGAKATSFQEVFLKTGNSRRTDVLNRVKEVFFILLISMAWMCAWKGIKQRDYYVADFKVAPMIPASWYLYLCVIPSPWVWVGHVTCVSPKEHGKHVGMSLLSLHFVRFCLASWLALPLLLALKKQ